MNGNTTRLPKMDPGGWSGTHGSTAIPVCGSIRQRWARATCCRSVTPQEPTCVKDSGRPGKSASALHYGHSAGVDFGFNVRPTVGSHLGMRISSFAPKKPPNGSSSLSVRSASISGMDLSRPSSADSFVLCIRCLDGLPDLACGSWSRRGWTQPLDHLGAHGGARRLPKLRWAFNPSARLA